MDTKYLLLQAAKANLTTVPSDKMNFVRMKNMKALTTANDVMRNLGGPFVDEKTLVEKLTEAERVGIEMHLKEQEDQQNKQNQPPDAPTPPQQPAQSKPEPPDTYELPMEVQQHMEPRQSQQQLAAQQVIAQQAALATQQRQEQQQHEQMQAVQRVEQMQAAQRQEQLQQQAQSNQEPMRGNTSRDRPPQKSNAVAVAAAAAREAATAAAAAREEEIKSHEEQFNAAFVQHQLDTKKLLKEAADANLPTVPMENMNAARMMNMETMTVANSALRRLGSKKCLNDNDVIEHLSRAEALGLEMLKKDTESNNQRQQQIDQQAQQQQTLTTAAATQNFTANQNEGFMGSTSGGREGQGGRDGLGSGRDGLGSGRDGLGAGRDGTGAGRDGLGGVGGARDAPARRDAATAASLRYQDHQRMRLQDQNYTNPPSESPYAQQRNPGRNSANPPVGGAAADNFANFNLDTDVFAGLSPEMQRELVKRLQPSQQGGGVSAAANLSTQRDAAAADLGNFYNSQGRFGGHGHHAHHPHQTQNSLDLALLQAEQNSVGDPNFNQLLRNSQGRGGSGMGAEEAVRHQDSLLQSAALQSGLMNQGSSLSQQLQSQIRQSQNAQSMQSMLNSYDQGGGGHGTTTNSSNAAGLYGSEQDFGGLGGFNAQAENVAATNALGGLSGLDAAMYGQSGGGLGGMDGYGQGLGGGYPGQSQRGNLNSGGQHSSSYQGGFPQNGGQNYDFGQGW